jgi:hypothetical protein
MARFTNQVKASLPPKLLAAYYRVRSKAARRHYSGLSVAEAFSQIYESNAWGGAPGEFCSGSGSTQRDVVESYLSSVNAFIEEHSLNSCVDLGCGDYRVGSGLRIRHYHGVDVVQALIDRNKAEYGSEAVSFQCLNFIEDRPPVADLALIRQVLQHLSNSEISRALKNCEHYRYVLVTEHVPIGPPMQYNIDKPHGADTRLLWNSGVFLDRPPFSLGTQVLHESAVDNWSVIRTVLLSFCRTESLPALRDTLQEGNRLTSR